ncbi:MAG: CHAT domain-containing protein [Planctomycetes bacterium]|nr:CHAT domain-containing protein [Planctomycetota bacterium]
MTSTHVRLIAERPRRTSCTAHARFIPAALWALAFALGAFAATSRAQNQPVPSVAYFASIEEFHDGQFRAAARDFLVSAQSGAIKAGTQRWIDSICYHTMAGDAFYQLGQFANANEQYIAALNLFVQHSSWMINVQFPAELTASASVTAQATVPWGRTERPVTIANIPANTMIQQGSLTSAASVLQRGGGVVQNPVLMPINVQEIVRCTAQAIRRRREIMGPSCPHDPLTEQVLSALQRRPGQPNHWSECYIDVMLGLAFSAAGKEAQAKTALERGMLANGQYDHPLTPIALVELARIALIAGDYPAAEKLYRETSYSAVNYGRLDVLEESFRYGLMTHLMANRKGEYPLLLPAAEWARRQGYAHVYASLLALSAENAIALGQPKAALDFVSKARAAMIRSDMNIARVGARVNYLHATALYESGNPTGVETPLQAFLAFQRSGSLWLYQISVVDSLYKNAAITDRVAIDLYDILLRDPKPADWLTEPMESLSVMGVPHEASYENWFEAAIKRKEYERALEISDLTRRHRFLSQMDFGGRLMNLRWLLEGPAEALDQTTTLQRQDLLTKYPRYKELQDKSRKLLAELRAGQLFFTEAPAAKQQAAKLAELASTSQAQEVILREIALRREPANIVFPPMRNYKDTQKLLTQGQALLSFYSTSRQTHAFLMTNDKYGYWLLASPSAVEKLTKDLLRGMGNWEQNKQLRGQDLQEAAWKKPAKELLDTLMRDSKVVLPYTFTELIIVPDNLLWYVPFESLLVSNMDGSEQAPLITKLKIRYAPTVGLAVGDTRPHRQGGTTGVVLGKMYPQDAADVTQRAYEDMERALVSPTSIHGHLHAPSGLLARLFDRLVVLSEILPNESSPREWAPIPLDAGSPGAQLAAWMSVPMSTPELVILPGFRTPAENSLKKPAAGQELFLGITSLMGCGARTVLISRWRTGGQSSYDLVREFTQEMPHTYAADAWQRAVLVVSERELNPTAEPRLNSAGLTTAPKGDHPFFWSSFLLADTGAPPKREDTAPPPLVDKAAADKAAADKAAGDKPAAGMIAPAAPPAGAAPAAKP